jgi:NADPH-dependent glutamate synthase beta subunit-like oxidoreductase/heterodisulfide reductase subunit B
MTELTEIEQIIEKCIGDNLPYCQATCPLHIDVRGYVALVKEGKYSESLRLIKEKLPFPGIMGRVCTHPCESKCKRGEVDEPIAIAALKRSAADYGQVDEDLTTAEEKKEKVAIVGGGPAGLMAAHDLRRMGYQVTIFEALPTLGGMLAVGIPEFRLPRDVLQSEISIIAKLGVKLRLNTKIGEDIKFSDLKRDFDAIFLAVGAHKGRELGIENERSEGLIDGVAFLRSLNLGKKMRVGKKVIVVGGGNVAIDCARTCLRLGSKDVTILYRRSRTEMPARKEETEQAEKEGAKLNFLTTPDKVLTKDGKVIGAQCIRLKLGEPDDSGRKRPVPIPGSEFVIETDMIIPAIGEQPDLSFLRETLAIKNGLPAVNSVTLETNIPGVFAGGDAATGPATVIDALAAGRKAAISIERYLKGEDLTLGRESEGTQESNLIVNIEGISKKQRYSTPTLPISQRQGNFDEVDLGFSEDEASNEAQRCLSCQCKLCVKDCEFLRLYCETPKELAEKFRAGYFREKPAIAYSCNICGLCQELCPQDLNIGDMCLALRQQMVEEGIGPLPQHQLVKRDQNWSTSDSVKLAQPDPRTAECKRAFFPGCALSGYSPELVMKVYDYLQEKLPGTGIILGCCGSPTHLIGDQSRFGEILSEVEAEMKRLGASELLVACPECYQTIKHNAPHLKIRSVYEVMAEQGLPETAKASANKVFSLHDPCNTRWEKEWQDSARALIKEMGYQIEEMEYSRDKTRCCGLGGMVPYADFELTKRISKKRVSEASHDIVTYCAACREAFAAHRPSIHILDLIFNPDWEKDMVEPPKTGKARRENQAKLKTMVQERLKS